MDIAEWLRRLDLAQYAEAFAANAVDWGVLPTLTADDLRDIGVVAVGHRRRLLNAIAALAPAAAAAPAEPVSAAVPASAAERRQLTVMFCDLVGSTALAAQLDPEDLRPIIAAYHAAASAALTRFGGFVAKYMGDGILAYFGYPQAHEEDAERAVRAALAIVAEIARLVLAEPLRVRIGIATGLVVVGDLIGEGAAQEQAVVGETPNLAARLQVLAGTDEIVVAEATRRQLGALFEVEELGARALAGFAEPQRAWRFVGESGVASRFEALRAGGAALTPLVGREEELELLLRRWGRAKAGDGQIVLVSGEAGIGKSRLTAALHERLAGEPHTRLRYFCSPHHQDSALYPVIAQLERAAGFARDDPPGARLDKLERLFGPAASPDDLALLAELLSLPAGERYPARQLTPARRKERTFAALLRQLEALARHQPVLMVYEDVHWIDPSLREFLDLTVAGAARLPVLLIITFRPEFQAPWGGLPQVATLLLNRLDPRAGAAMIANIVGNQGLPAEVAAEIIERTDGIPLFVEELTKAVLEAGGGDEVHRTLAGAASAAGAVPPALHASLMARLDRLGPQAKGVAQTGAAIGREFAYELLAPLVQLATPELTAALDRPSEAGLVFQRGAPPEASYLFKHALVRDAAYSTLLRGRRRGLHAAIAATLERGFPEIVAAQPEVLAHHYTEAGLTDQAIANWRRAGDRATERSANLEAIAHLTRGIEVLRTLPEGPQRDERELAFQVALMTPLMASRGIGSAEIEGTATRALALCRQRDAETAAHYRAMYAVGWVYLARGKVRAARELAEQLLGLAERLQDPELLAYAHHDLGNALFWCGELAAARRHLETGIALHDPQWSRAATLRFGFNCASHCRLFLARVLWHLGYPEQALSCSDQAVAIAEAASHVWSQTCALSWAAALHQLRGEVERTRSVAEADLALTKEQAIVFLDAHAMVLRGWALVKQGQGEEGIVQLADGLAAYRATGADLESPHWLALLAEACRDTGRIGEGVRAVAEALDQAAQTGIVYYEAELHRLEGELRLRLDAADGDAAEAAFRRAIDIARRQQAKSWELRAATSLARLWGDQGRRAEARDLLAPVYGWFTEGFATADLTAAKALTDALA